MFRICTKMGIKVLFRKNDSDIIKENFTLVSCTYPVKHVSLVLFTKVKEISRLRRACHIMNDIAKIIGTRIKMLRFAKHMQQTELAKRMGISQTHMSNIESGRNNVTVDNLYKLHEILECPMSSFFVDIDGKEEEKETKDVFSLEDLAQALILLKK